MMVLLPALPKMVWALWLDPQHRAAKMHVHFDVLKGVPIETTVTAGNDSEIDQLRATLQAERLYVIDRGYAEYELFQDIINAKSDFIGRIREDISAPNGLAFFNKLQEAKVPSELQVFEQGGHGFSLHWTQGMPNAAWPELLLNWAATHGFKA